MEIKGMADILLKGGKMLNRSCPECNAPLFKYEDRTFCAKCNWKEGEEIKLDKDLTQASDGDNLKGEPLDTLSQLQFAVLNRIQEYSANLKNDSGEGNLDQNIRNLSSLLDLLDRILEMKKSC